MLELGSIEVVHSVNKNEALKTQMYVLKAKKKDYTTWQGVIYSTRLWYLYINDLE